MKSIKFKYLIIILVVIIAIEPIIQVVKIQPLTFEKYEKSKNKQVNLIFRNDDLSQFSDIEKESEIVNIFSSYQIKPLYVIIPYKFGESINNNQIVVDSLKQWIHEGKIIPAIHGYTHERNKYKAGEFKRLSFKEQYEMIKKGKNYLDSLLETDIRIFAPPWNQADKNTIKACKANGIDIFSGYLYAPIVDGMHYLNTTSNLFDGPLGTIDMALKNAISSDFNSLHVLLFHSSYDFNSDNIFMLDSLLNSLTGQPEFNFIDISDNQILPICESNKFMSSQLSYIDNNYKKLKIVSYLCRLIGFNSRGEHINKYQEAVWSGDIQQQYMVVKAYTYRSLFFLTLQRLVVCVFLIMIFIQCVKRFYYN